MCVSVSLSICPLSFRFGSSTNLVCFFFCFIRCQRASLPCFACDFSFCRCFQPYNASKRDNICFPPFTRLHAKMKHCTRELDFKLKFKAERILISNVIDMLCASIMAICRQFFILAWQRCEQQTVRNLSKSVYRIPIDCYCHSHVIFGKSYFYCEYSPFIVISMCVCVLGKNAFPHDFHLHWIFLDAPRHKENWESKSRLNVSFEHGNRIAA